jgi:hypothetical protein
MGKNVCGVGDEDKPLWDSRWDSGIDKILWKLLGGEQTVGRKLKRAADCRSSCSLLSTACPILSISASACIYILFIV